MPRTISSRILVAAAIALAATVTFADELLPPPLQNPALGPAAVKSSPSLFNGFIAPGVGARLREDSAAALDFISPSANPWTRDPRTVGRVEANAISATKNAVKRYVVEQLGLNGWSVPLAGGNGHGLASMRTDAGGMRLRFGISHMAPRAELLIPAGNTGRVAIGVDGRGHMAASFETASWNWRIGGSYDPSSHDLAIGIVSRF